MDMTTIGVIAALLINVSALVMMRRREAEERENKN